MFSTAVLFLLGTAPCFAQSTHWEPARSIRSTLERRLDVLDLPRYHQRQSGFVKELRNAHFIIDAPTSALANWAFQEAERAWEDLSIIADGFLTYHRQPTFAIGAVTIRIDGKPYRRPTPDERGPSLVNDGLEIYWNISDHEGPLEEGLPNLRREISRSFFRVARMDQRLPAWALDGLAEYIAADGATITDAQATSRGPADVSLEGPIRPVPDRLVVPSSDHAKAALWIHYFLDSNRGSRAVKFASAASECLRQNPVPEQLPTVRTSGLNHRIERFYEPQGDPITNLVSRSDVQRDAGEWLSEPDAGDPQFLVGERHEGIEANQAARLMTILRLAQRFGNEEPTIRKPQIIVITPESARIAQPTATAPDPQPERVDLEQLRRGLIDNPPRPWSMTGADGRIVYSWQSDRLSEQLNLLNSRTTAVSDGRGGWVIEERGDSRGVLRLTYEPANKQHRRPQATFEWTTGDAA